MSLPSSIAKRLTDRELNKEIEKLDKEAEKEARFYLPKDEYTQKMRELFKLGYCMGALRDKPQGGTP